MIRILLVAAFTIGSFTSAFAMESNVKTLKVERGLTAEGKNALSVMRKNNLELLLIGRTADMGM